MIFTKSYLTNVILIPQGREKNPATSKPGTFLGI
jgi:hypothetical protein